MVLRVYMRHTHSTNDYAKIKNCVVITWLYSSITVSNVATDSALDVKLTEKYIATLLELIHTFSSKWDEIGTMLEFAPSEIENIRNMPLLVAKAPKSWLKELLSQWVQWPTLSHPTKPTLRALCTSLRSSLVGLGSLADKVDKEMKQSLTCKDVAQS